MCVLLPWALLSLRLGLWASGEPPCPLVRSGWGGAAALPSLNVLQPLQARPDPVLSRSSVKTGGIN